MKRPSPRTARRSPSSTGRVARSSPGQPAVAVGRTTTAADLSEKLAALLTMVDRFGEARTAALAGLARVHPEDALRAARLQYVLANIEFQDHNFDAALAACDAVDELIGPCGVNDDQERVDLWVRAAPNELLCTFGATSSAASAVIESARRWWRQEAAGGRGVFFQFALASTCVSGATGSTRRSSKNTGGQLRPLGRRLGGEPPAWAPTRACGASLSNRRRRVDLAGRFSLKPSRYTSRRWRAPSGRARPEPGRACWSSWRSRAGAAVTSRSCGS